MSCTNTSFCLQSKTVSTLRDPNSFSAKQKQRKKYIDQNNCITHANSVILVAPKTPKLDKHSALIPERNMNTMLCHQITFQCGLHLVDKH